MKFIKFLSLITIISCAPALYSMEKDNTVQEQQSRVPKLVDLCLPGAIEQINDIINKQCTKPKTYEAATDLLKEIEDTFHVSNFLNRGLIDKLYRSNEVFKHCIDLIIDEIWNRCQKVTGATLDKTINEIHQNLLSRIPKELLSFIVVHFCKQKGWYVPYCLLIIALICSIALGKHKSTNFGTRLCSCDALSSIEYNAGAQEMIVISDKNLINFMKPPFSSISS